MYTLTLVDLLNLTKSNGSPTSSIPVAVESLVTYTQFLTLCVAVWTQNDMVIALKLLYEGFGDEKHHHNNNDNDNNCGLRDAFVGATYGKWLTAVLLLLLEGALGLVATLYLTITSTTILDVLLNFAAVEFISSLDDVAFFLASIGYLGQSNRREAQLVATTQYQVPQMVKPVYQILFMMFFLFWTMVCWMVVLVHQLQGGFVPRAFVVQFDDEIRTDLGTHSGIYTIQTSAISLRNFFFNRGRFRYVETSGQGDGRFDYCHSQGTWTFFVGSDDPCVNVVAMAAELNTYDITETGSGAWLGLKPTTDSTFVPLNYVYLAAVCESDGDCNGHGSCTRWLCECEDGFTGPRCDFDVSTLCRSLKIDESFGTRFDARRQLATTYDLLVGQDNDELVTPYGRPMYVNNMTKDIIFYTGLRWVVTNPLEWNFDGFNKSADAIDEIALLFADAHRFPGVVGHIDAVSDPVYYNSPQDSSTPSTLLWYTVADGAPLWEAQWSTTALSAVLLCSICNADLNPCINGNSCLSSGVCDCQHGEEGVLCQILPTGNGMCNTFFNTPVFDHDQGDCCASTCAASTFPCGSARFSKDNLVSIGFPHCIESSVIGHCNAGAKCYVRFSPPIKALLPPPSATVGVEIWQNGQVIVLAEHDLISSIRIETASVPQIVQAGNTIELGPHLIRIATASSRGNIVSTNAGSIPRGFVAYNLDHDDIRVVHFGALSNALDWDVNIDFKEFGIGNDPLCTEIVYVGGGFTSFIVERRLMQEETVLVGLNDTCQQSSTTNGSLPVGDTFAFWKALGASAWNFRALGNWDDRAVSGNGLFMGLHSAENGIGTSIKVCWGDVIGSTPVVVEFSLQEVLAHVLNVTGTSFTRMAAFSLSHRGHHLCVAANARDSATQREFGILARIVIFDQPKGGPLSEPVPLQPVVPVAFLDTFPPFREIRFDTERPDRQLTDSIVVSAEGSTVAVHSYSPTTGESVEVYTIQRNNVLGHGDWRHLASFVAQDHGVGEIQKFAVNHDGTSLVVSGDGYTTRYDLRDLCDSHEVPLHLSIQLDFRPETVTWRVESFLSLDTNQTFVRSVVRECAGCYPPEDDYTQSVVKEHVCIPRAELNCIAINFNFAAATIASVFAFLEDESGTVPLLSLDTSKAKGAGGTPSGVISKQWYSPSCNVTAAPRCDDPTKSWFLLGMTFTRLDGEISWGISGSGSGVLESMNRTLTVMDVKKTTHSSWLEEACLARDECWALAFSSTGLFRLSYLMGILDGVEVEWSGITVNEATPQLRFGNC